MGSDGQRWAALGSVGQTQRWAEPTAESTGGNGGSSGGNGGSSSKRRQLGGSQEPDGDGNGWRSVWLARTAPANLAVTLTFLIGGVWWAFRMETASDLTKQSVTKLSKDVDALGVKLGSRLDALRADLNDGKTRNAVVIAILGTLVACGALALITAAATGRRDSRR